MQLPGLSVYAAPPLLGAVVLAALAALVLRRRRRKRSHILFALVNLSAAVWNLDVFMLYTVRDPGLALILDRLAQPVIITIPLLWVLFFTTFLGVPRRALIVACFAVPTGILLPLSPTALFIRGTASYYFGYYGLAGPWYRLFIFLHLSSMSLSAALLLRRLRRATDPDMRNQLRYLLLAGLMAILTADNFFPLYGVEKYPFGNLAVIVYLLMVGMAIVRYRFMEIGPVLRKSLIYSIATLVLTLVYLGVILLLEVLLRGWLPPHARFTHLAPTLVVAVMFHGVKTQVQKRLDRLFGLEGRRAGLIAEFARTARGGPGRRELCRHYCQAMVDGLGVEQCTFFSRDLWSGRWRVEEGGGLPERDLVYLKEGPLVRLESPHAEIVRIRKGGRGLAEEDLRRLSDLGFGLAVPLQGRSAAVAAGFFGPQNPRRGWSVDDLTFAEALSVQAAAVLEAREYHDRWRREEKFTSLGRASAAISHQLRNPLSVMRGAAACLERKPVGADAAKLVRIINGEIDKSARFIEQFLSAARLPRARPLPLDLEALLKDFTASQVREHAGVDFSLLVKGPLRAVADPLLLGQALGNLCRNAVEAMEGRGRVTISAACDDGVKGASLHITVADEGSGLSAEALDNLCAPFFTTKPGGHGLGLCVVESIVRAHGGHLEVASRPGCGTAFSLLLPVDGGVGSPAEMPANGN